MVSFIRCFQVLVFAATLSLIESTKADEYIYPTVSTDPNHLSTYSYNLVKLKNNPPLFGNGGVEVWQKTFTSAQVTSSIAQVLPLGGAYGELNGAAVLHFSPEGDRQNLASCNDASFNLVNYLTSPGYPYFPNLNSSVTVSLVSLNDPSLACLIPGASFTDFTQPVGTWKLGGGPGIYSIHCSEPIMKIYIYANTEKLIPPVPPINYYQQEELAVSQFSIMCSAASQKKHSVVTNNLVVSQSVNNFKFDGSPADYDLVLGRNTAISFDAVTSDGSNQAVTFSVQLSDGSKAITKCND